MGKRRKTDVQEIERHGIGYAVNRMSRFSLRVEPPTVCIRTEEPTLFRAISPVVGSERVLMVYFSFTTKRITRFMEALEPLKEPSCFGHLCNAKNRDTDCKQSYLPLNTADRKPAPLTATAYSNLHCQT